MTPLPVGEGCEGETREPSGEERRASDAERLRPGGRGEVKSARPPLFRLYPPFSPSDRYDERARDLAYLQAEMLACQRCVLAGYLPTANAVAGVRGRIGNRVMVIGQAPGHLSVERGRPFMGPGGVLLDRWLQRAGYLPGALHREVYIASLTRCFPGKNPRGGGDRKPSPPELALCRPFLQRELAIVRPSAVLLVGGMAIEAFLGPAKLDEVVGTAVERAGVHLLPLPHPSGVSRWLNTPAHQALLSEGLAHLAAWRVAWEAEDACSASPFPLCILTKERGQTDLTPPSAPLSHRERDYRPVCPP